MMGHRCRAGISGLLQAPSPVLDTHLSTQVQQCSVVCILFFGYSKENIKCLFSVRDETYIKTAGVK